MYFVMINDNLLNDKVKAVILHFRNESNKNKQDVTSLDVQ